MYDIGNCHKGYYCENGKLETVDCGNDGKLSFNYPITIR